MHYYAAGTNDKYKNAMKSRFFIFALSPDSVSNMKRQ